ncbi:hypothetical protein D3C78_1164890 [compost metagenome]
MQKVVLDHIAHLASLVEIAPASFDAHFLGHGNFDVIDGAIIPVIGKQGVSKTQCQQVQHRLFAKIVVDTIDLTLFEIFAYLVVDFA